MVTYTIFSVKWGWVGLSATKVGLCRLVLPKQNKNEVILELNSIINQNLVYETSGFKKIKKILIDYFSGFKVHFDVFGDLTSYTSFQRKVWEITQTIPYGQRISYGWIAQKLGNHRASRAVGQALKTNPLPIIIPCHRVIAKDGSLGGFSAGLIIKRRLLDLEQGGGN